MRSFASLFLAATLFAQSDWAILSSIPADKKIRIRLHNGVSLRRFIRADSARINLLENKQEVRHARSTGRKAGIRSGTGRALNPPKARPSAAPSDLSSSISRSAFISSRRLKGAFIPKPKQTSGMLGLLLFPVGFSSVTI